MTENQKEKIHKFRMQGYGYIKIAQELGISENTVKSYCRRNKLTGEYTKCSCKYCGKKLTSDKQVSFCSESCRKKYWTENQTLINRKSAVNYVCPICKQLFTDYARKHRKYCSHKCYIAERYKGGELDG